MNQFLIAKPIVADELRDVLNAFATFTAEVGSLSGAELHICAADFYRVTLNGAFVAHGPARTAKGYARMDRIPLDGLGKADRNRLDISVVGYQCRSLSAVKQPMFLWAEVVRGEEVLAATGRDFVCLLSDEKVRKTARYSAQRHFPEEWDLRKPRKTRTASVSVMENPPEVIERVAPYPVYLDTDLTQAEAIGRFWHEPPEKIKTNAYSFKPDAYWGCYDENEVKHSYIRVQEQKQLPQRGRIPRGHSADVLPLRNAGKPYLHPAVDHVVHSGGGGAYQPLRA
ncbi:MAG TPA: hypothetical protein DDW30_04135 [Clostridiales bacterium]|mgnify:CR=1 FL=1|nr:hypothetical protein [Clostridiales bacterium]